jgi:hypothetical protein
VPQNDKKEGILHSAYAPFRMTEKDVQNDKKDAQNASFFVILRLFICHPEGFSPKGLLWRFFGTSCLRMTKRRGFFGCDATSE